MEGLAAKPLRVSAAAARIGVSPKTIRAWADGGRLKSTRSPSGQRWIDPEDVERIRRAVFGTPAE